MSDTSLIDDHTSIKIWARLTQLTDLAFYRPQRAAGVQVARVLGREGPTFVLKNPAAQSYIQIGERDYALWWQMDGRRTVKDLVLYYFRRYGAFAFGRVTELVSQLKAQRFLKDEPVHVFEQVEQGLDERTTVHWGRRLVNAFLSTELTVAGLDPWMTRLYRLFRFAFTWQAQGIWIMVVCAGVGAFANTLISGRYPVFQQGGSYSLGLVSLLLFNLAVLFFHELAHGLTTKHFGRELDRGGVMIYWGFPSFFVDTQDIWMEGRAARVAVSWAGPFSGLVVGSICSLTIWIFPAGSFNPLLFQIAFLAYLNAFINLNPLLELDGYFMLMDWLEIPHLRQRAFEFWKRQPFSQLFAFSSWDREEKIYAAFGAMAALYSVYSLYLAGVFWNSQLWNVLRDVWSERGPAGRAVAVSLALLLLSLVGFALLTQAMTLAKRILDWLERRDLLERPAVIVLGLALGLLALLLIPMAAQEPWRGQYFAFAPTLLLALALIGLILLAHQYAGSHFQWALWSLVASVGVRALGEGLRGWQALSAHDSWYGPVGTTLVYLSSLPLLAAGLGSLMVGRLRYTRLWERFLLAFLLVFAFLGPLTTIRWTAGQHWLVRITAAGAPYFAFIFVIATIPTLLGFVRTRFLLPWLLLVGAATLNAALDVLYLRPTGGEGAWFELGRLAGAGLWALAGLGYSLIGRRVHFVCTNLAESVSLGDREQLQLAFSHFAEGLFVAFRAVFGQRQARRVDDEIDLRAAAAGWGVTIEDGLILETQDFDLDLIALGERYREVLESVMDLMDDMAGTVYMRRAAQSAYDVLPWPEEEVLGLYVLLGTEWGRAIADQFAGDKGERLHLLRQVPLFAGFDDEGLASLLAVLHKGTAGPGEILARQGEDSGRFFLIASGQVDVWRRVGNREHLFGKLGRGGIFGSKALLDEGDYSATYRAVSQVRYFTFRRPEFDPLLRADTVLASQVASHRDIVGLLARMPLFDELCPQQLGVIAQQMKRQVIPAGTVIVAAGQPRSDLFVVDEGQVEAIGDGGLPVGRFGPGEHFGEYALFADTPYQATYRAVVDAVLLTLDELTFDALTAASRRMAHYVEQVGSGRLLLASRHCSSL